MKQLLKPLWKGNINFCKASTVDLKGVMPKEHMTCSISSVSNEPDPSSSKALKTFRTSDRSYEVYASGTYAPLRSHLSWRHLRRVANMVKYIWIHTANNMRINAEHGENMMNKRSKYIKYSTWHGLTALAFLAEFQLPNQSNKLRSETLHLDEAQATSFSDFSLVRGMYRIHINIQ